MKKHFARALTPGILVIATILASALVAGFTTLRSSRDVVERHVSVWEEEVARNLLLKGDARLFEKIQLQILDLASDVETTGPNAKIKQATGSCFAGQTVNVTLYGTPAGELHVCRSPQRLAMRSLASPVFAFGILAGLLLASWLVRRSHQQESDRRLNELALRVAHDIRSPLMALKIAAGQVQGATSDAIASRDVKVLIESATDRISAIADELLKQNRLDPSAPRPKPLDESIRTLINEKRLLAAANVVFDFRGPKTPDGLQPAMSSFDFERVVSNLLQNAIEATAANKTGEDGNQKVSRISVDASETPTDISVTIRDNGIGIPAEVLPRLGEVGFSYGKKSGNGIGFSSARSWARSVGGDLDIRSLVGTGTEVRLTIPRL